LQQLLQRGSQPQVRQVRKISAMIAIPSIILVPTARLNVSSGTIGLLYSK
jgi:hypothetical protein